MSDDNEKLNRKRRSGRDRKVIKRQKSESESLNSEESQSEDDFVDYFESDNSKLRRSITKHILANLTDNQRSALTPNVKKGVNQAFHMFGELMNESFENIIGQKPTTNLWKLGMGPTEIKKYAPQLAELRMLQDKKEIGIKQILESNLTKDKKAILLGLYDSMQAEEPHSFQYMTISKEISTILEATEKSSLTKEDMNRLNRVETELKAIIGSEIPLKVRILDAEIDNKRKAAIYEKYLLLQSSGDGTSSANIEEWIEHALKTPYTKMKPTLFEGSPGEALIQLKNKFQEHISELDVVLEPLLTVFNNWMHQPDSGSLVIGLLGSPGVGKTYVGQVIAEAWELPFQQISLGGLVDSSILDGQHQGWVGSNPGRFAKALQEMGVINGVIFLDEIDKLGQTHHGIEVQASLLHSIDPIQNDKFIDHYLGNKLPLDLGKGLIICALNKVEGLDPALLNRMHIINVPDYTPEKKTNIMLRHLFPKALKKAGLEIEDLILPKEACLEIQKLAEQNIGKEGGVRNEKAYIRVIVDKLSLLMRTTTEEKQQLQLSFDVDVSKLPLTITPEIVNKLSSKRELKNTWTHMYI